MNSHHSNNVHRVSSDTIKTFKIESKPNLQIRVGSNHFNFRQVSVRQEIDYFEDLKTFGAKKSFLRFAQSRLVTPQTEPVPLISELPLSEQEQLAKALLKKDGLEEIKALTNPFDAYEIARRNKIRTLVSSVNQTFKPVQEFATELRKQFSGAIPKLPTMVFPKLDELFENLRNLHDDWFQFERSSGMKREEGIKILEKFGWLITPSLPSSLLIASVKAGKSPSKPNKAINDTFATYFKTNSYYNLWQLYDDWSESTLFQKHLKIIRNCFEVVAGNQNKKTNTFNVALPALVSQTEGILTNFLSKHNYHESTKPNYDKKAAAYKKATIPLMQAETRHLAESLIFDQFLKSTDRRKGNEIFNRHKIMHGLHTRYGRSDYFYKVVLILDYLFCCDVYKSIDSGID